MTNNYDSHVSGNPPSPTTNGHLPGAVNSVSEFLRSGVELNYIASYLVLILPKEKINLMAVS